MSEAYTPTKAQIEDAYVQVHGSFAPGEHEKSLSEFDRWLAERDRQVAERAWGEGEEAGLIRADFEYGVGGYQNVRGNPYRAAKREQK